MLEMGVECHQRPFGVRSVNFRHRLRQQEMFQARRSQQAWRQEIEMARRQIPVPSQQSSSMPLASTTSDAGWEYVHSQGSQKGVVLPVGNEVRSPELNSPMPRSPVSKNIVTSEVRADAPATVKDTNVGHSSGPSMPSSSESMQGSSQFRTFLASGGYGTGNAEAQQSERANAFRGAQFAGLGEGPPHPPFK